MTAENRAAATRHALAARPDHHACGMDLTPAAPGAVTIDLTRRLPGVEAATAISRAIAAGRPARRTATRSTSAIIGHFPSAKMGEAFSAESALESDALLLADVMEDVAAYRPQAVGLLFHDGTRMRRAFPDLCVQLLDGTAEVWEVKPERRSPQIAARLAQVGAALATGGVRYRVLTPRWLHRRPRLDNARLLHRQCGRPLPPGAATAAARALAGLAAPTVGGLARALGATAADIHALAARGALAINIDAAPLGDGTPVRAALPGARSGGFCGGGY